MPNITKYPDNVGHGICAKKFEESGSLRVFSKNLPDRIIIIKTQKMD